MGRNAANLLTWWTRVEKAGPSSSGQKSGEQEVYRLLALPTGVRKAPVDSE